jgi:hypothetical protein
MLSASGTPIPAPTGSLGLNSARLYGLYGSGTRPVGTRGSPYKQGSLADYASYLQPKEFDRRRIAGRRLSGTHHAGQPRPQRQFHQDEETIRRDGARAEQYPVRLDADQRVALSLGSVRRAILPAE